MRSPHRYLVLALLLPMAGCTFRHDYVWHEYPIAPERISADAKWTGEQEVRIIQGEADETKVDLGHVGAHHYYESEQYLTARLAEQLGSELRTRGLETKDTAAKSLEVAVSGSRFESGMWQIAANLEVTVKMGNGETRSYKVRNSTPGTVERAYNGAIALVVIDILNDAGVQGYLNK